MSHEAMHLEQTLVFHCAPSLSRLKPADLISWRPPTGDGAALLADYTRLLARQGVCLRVLRQDGKRYLLLVYRPELLRSWLARREVRTLLNRDGYPQALEEMLLHLTARLSQGAFPHEIGLFLGYPAADVEGFRIHRGKNCKLSGLWKVYDQVEEAAQKFRDFLHCREHLCSQMAAGKTLTQLLAAV